MRRRQSSAFLAIAIAANASSLMTEPLTKRKQKADILLTKWSR